MNPELVVRLAPVAVFLVILLWFGRRSRNAYRLQEEAAARYRELTPRLLESIDWQREGLAVGRKQLETLQALLDEIRALRADLKNR